MLILCVFFFFFFFFIKLFCLGKIMVNNNFPYLIRKISFLNNSATSWQNQQNDCAQRRLRSDWADQSLHCALNGLLRTPAFFMWRNKDSDQTGQMPRLIWVFDGSTCRFYTPSHKKWQGIMLYPSKILKFRVSVRPSVRQSALRFRTLTWVDFERFSSNFAWTLISGRSGLGLQMG